MIPDPHSVVTEHNLLTLDSNLGQLSSATECGLEAAKRAVVIPFDDMDMPADNPIPVTPRLIGSAHAEVAQKVQNVALTDPAIEVPKDRLVHLAS